MAAPRMSAAAVRSITDVPGSPTWSMVPTHTPRITVDPSPSAGPDDVLRVLTFQVAPAAVAPQYRDWCAEFLRLGGHIVRPDLPRSATFAQVAEQGWHLHLFDNDVVLPVCHEGLNRSQMAYVALEAAQKTLLQDSGRTFALALPHGAVSGYDVCIDTPMILTAGDEASFVGYVQMFSETPSAAISEDTPKMQRIRDDPGYVLFGQAFGRSRMPRVGHRLAVANGWADLRNVETDDWAVREKLKESRDALHAYFTEAYYNPRALRALRGTSSGRVIFVLFGDRSAFNDAGSGIATRLVEAAHAAGTTLDCVYLLWLEKVKDEVRDFIDPAAMRAAVGAFASVLRVHPSARPRGAASECGEPADGAGAGAGAGAGVRTDADAFQLVEEAVRLAQLPTREKINSEAAFFANALARVYGSSAESTAVHVRALAGLADAVKSVSFESFFDSAPLEFQPAAAIQPFDAAADIDMFARVDGRLVCQRALPPSVSVATSVLDRAWLDVFQNLGGQVCWVTPDTLGVRSAVYGRTPVVLLKPSDFVMPVCHEGTHRSQVMYLVLRQAMYAARGGHAAGGRVALPFGAKSGFVPPMAARLTPATFGARFIWEPSDGDALFEAAFGTHRHAPLGLGLSPFVMGVVHPLHEYPTLEVPLAELELLTARANFFKPIFRDAVIQAYFAPDRLRMLLAEGGDVVIFAFGAAAMSVASFITTAAIQLGQDCSRIRIVGLALPASIQTPEQARAAYQQYASLLRVPASAPALRPCSVCTFINPASATVCEMCGSPLGGGDGDVDVGAGARMAYGGRRRSSYRR